MSEGRVFQSVGAATEKDLAPYVFKLKCGIERRPSFEDDRFQDSVKTQRFPTEPNNLLNFPCYCLCILFPCC